MCFIIIFISQGMYQKSSHTKKIDLHLNSSISKITAVIFIMKADGRWIASLLLSCSLGRSFVGTGCSWRACCGELPLFSVFHSLSLPQHRTVFFFHFFIHFFIMCLKVPVCHFCGFGGTNNIVFLTDALYSVYGHCCH